MTIHKCLIVVIVLSIIDILNTPIASSMQQKQSTQQPVQQDPLHQMVNAAVAEALSGQANILKEFNKKIHECIDPLNESIHLARYANGSALDALEKIKEVSAHLSETRAGVEQVKNLPADLKRQAQAISANLERDSERISTALLNVLKVGRGNPEEKTKTKLAEIAEKKRLGIYEQEASIMAEGNVKVEKARGEWVREMIGDPKLMIKIAVTIVVIALCIYILKYGLPVLVNYLTRPRVISETSRPGLFEWFKPKQTVNIDDLIFAPSLQNQLFDLLLRVQTAKKYDELLPNVLFYGAPGTGKTAFVKALAYESGLDYALTSGSEFAKITDLNQANNELRKLLKWAKRSKNGLIVFIDEAESLFANRKLQTTSKSTQDFINTFLSLVSDQSQKKVMFIFATNHPFKLDDAITNRVGTNIEFTLPEAPEREKILSTYLVKSAQENEAAIVDLHPDVIKLLPAYADELKGFSPRAIKFVAEEMIINARRQESMQLTNDIAQAVMDQAKHSLRQAVLWETERKEWSGDANVIHS